MSAPAEWLPLVWGALIAFAVFMYVVMDGFDLGIGILFPVFHDADERDLMVNSVAPVWDGNETWLVLGGGGLLAVFPTAYAVLLPALYMPLTLMLLALVFRGVAFEMRFRARSDRSRLWWDRAFSGGSYGATICQGVCLGAYVQGVRVSGHAYAGGWWDWLTPFSLLTAAALVAGYALLGACWLIWRTEGELQGRCREAAVRLGGATLVFVAVVSASMLFLDTTFRERWLGVPYVFGSALVPIATGLLALAFLKVTRGRGEATPFLCALGVFLMGYIGLGVSLWPNIIPPSVTLWQAAAPPQSQGFLLAGAAFILPVILGYTAFVYWLFRGKVKAGHNYH